MIFVRLLRFAGWPVLTGLIAAATLLATFPTLIAPDNAQGNMQMETLGPTANGDWGGPASYADAVNRAAPSVINIYTRKLVKRRRHPLLDDPFFRRFFNSRSPVVRPQFGLGSGVIMTAEGFILTNLHVVEGAEQIEVQLQDGRQASARIVGADPATDLTVLKIDLDNLSPISVGDSMHAKVGDVVLAIGNPHGVGQTVTQGIISATQRYGFNMSAYENYLQTDAAINPGNSGGALVDAYGNLLGINTFVLDETTSGMATGISFAIPADTAIKVLQDIVEYGRVIRGWLGIMRAAQISDQQAQQMGLGSVAGLLVEKIYNNSPAEEAGLRPGDIITHINNHRVIDTDYGRVLVARVMPGETIELKVVRQGEELTVSAVAGTTPQVGDIQR